MSNQTNYENDINIIDREDERNDLKEPSKYKVILLNDDFTPMDWVVYILETCFGHSMDAAVNIMMDVHSNGKGVAGIYPKDIAETKAAQVNLLSQRKEYPFRTTIEEE